MTETWKTVSRDCRYEVSDLGRVRNAESGRVLKPRLLKSGYHRVALGAGDDSYIHHLVLEAFVSPRPSGCDASHLNGKRGDNRRVNLAWETPKANNRRRYDHGTVLFGDRNPSGAKTCCKRGHEFTDLNTRTSTFKDGTVHRVCRTCARDDARRRRVDQFGPAETRRYRFNWRRLDRFGQICRLVARGTLNSCMLEFDDGFRVVTSRNAIRRL